MAAADTGEWADLGWSMLNRVVDNELRDEYMPSPNSGSDDQTYVKTSNDQTGKNKVAGSGASIFKSIPNTVMYGAAALIGVGLFAYIVTR